MSICSAARCACALVAAGVALWPPLQAQGSESQWSERQVIDAFYAQSPVIREARARAEATRAEAQGRTLYANPEVSFSHESAGLNQFFEIRQTLPVTGRRQYLREAGTAAIAVSESDSAALLWNQRSDLRRAFFRVLAAQEYESTIATGIGDLDEAIRILKVREEEGEGSKYDRLRAERERSEIGSQLAVARSTLAQARAGLAAFLPPETTIPRVTGSLSVNPLPPSSEELTATALSSRAEFRAEQQRITRAQAEQKAAERLRYPEPIVTLGLKRADVPVLATPGRLGSEIVYGPAATVTVPIPIFNKGKTEIERYRAEQEQASARRETLERRIRAEVAGAREVLELRQKTLSAYRTEVADTGVELNRIARTSYQEGEVGILELLDSYRVNLQARVRLLELQAAVKEAGLELDRVAGTEVTQ